MEQIYVNQQEAASLLGVHYTTLRRWERQGKGPKVYRLEGLPRYRRQELEELKPQGERQER